MCVYACIKITYATEEPVILVRIRWIMEVDNGNTKITRDTLKVSVFKILKLDTIRKREKRRRCIDNLTNLLDKTG